MSAALVISAAPDAYVASDVSDNPEPLTPYTTGWPDTSHDEEIVRKLFIKLNHKAIGILAGGGLVILSSNDEDKATKLEEEVDKGEEEEAKDETTGGGSLSRS